MRFPILALLVMIAVSPVSAEFFPNVSAIPPWLVRNATRSAWEAFKNLSGCHVGENVEGLSRLKRYFQRFGYIDESLIPRNLTDDFDDMLESAIKTYQRNFKLNETGELDESTMRHITLPRCGNPDIVNGSTTMHGGRKYETSTRLRGIHAVKHYAFFPGMPRWSKRELTYAFLPQNQLTEEVKGVFTRAFERWARVTRLTFTRSESYFDADITIAFFAGEHGDGEPFDGVLGTLAHAFSPPSGRFHLDADENWVVSSDITTLPTSSAVHLESVAVHEIGHLLGLGHSSVEDAIMYPTITTGNRKVELTNDDIEGIQTLYGANPDFNGSSTEPVGERERSDVGGGANGGRGRSWVSGISLAVGVLSWLLQSA